jgi:hypothetical protein
MSVMNPTKLSAQIRSIKMNTKKVREQIKEALISCAYYAAKDGNTNPFNQLLEAVGTATRIKGLTMWAELYGFVVVKHEKFALNKSARKEANVTDEASFAPFEKAMREGPMWFDVAPAQPVKSIFDPSHYLSGVIAKLEKEGAAEVVPYITKAIDQYNLDVAAAKLKAEDQQTVDA